MPMLALWWMSRLRDFIFLWSCMSSAVVVCYRLGVVSRLLVVSRRLEKVIFVAVYVYVGTLYVFLILDLVTFYKSVVILKL